MVTCLGVFMSPYSYGSHGAKLRSKTKYSILEGHGPIHAPDFTVALPLPTNHLRTYFFKEVFSTPRCFCFSTKPLFIPLSFFKGSLVLRSFIDVSIPQRLCYMLPQPPTKQIIFAFQKCFLRLPPWAPGSLPAVCPEQKQPQTNSG